jgi:hypothetical protein
MSVRTTIVRIVALAACAASLSSVTPALADWTGNCTPDLIHVYPDRLATRCQETGIWYYIAYADHPAGHVDRTARMIHAVQLSGKKVLFHDVGPWSPNPNDRKYDMVALPK